MIGGVEPGRRRRTGTIMARRKDERKVKRKEECGRGKASSSWEGDTCVVIEGRLWGGRGTRAPKVVLRTRLLPPPST